MTTLSKIIDKFCPDTPCSTPPDWRQGRTAYGGFSAALSLQSALKQTPFTLPPLRTAQFAFLGPVADDITFRTQVIRQGKSATSIAVDCHTAGQVALRSTLFFAQDRSSAICHDLTVKPIVNEPGFYDSPCDAPYLPSFFTNFDVRFASNVVPVSDSPNPELIAWVKLKDARDIDPQLVLLAIGDCLPPAAMACFSTAAPISSMNWAIDFVHTPKSTHGWFLLRSRSVFASHGYSHQQMEAWDEDGQLLMIGTQTVAIFA